jgi:hypothetical protein
VIPPYLIKCRLENKKDTGTKKISRLGLVGFLAFCQGGWHLQELTVPKVYVEVLERSTGQ